MQKMGTGHIGPSGKTWNKATPNKSVNKTGPYIDINDLNIRIRNLLIKFIMIIESSLK
jgi:hypothetical protein